MGSSILRPPRGLRSRAGAIDPVDQAQAVVVQHVVQEQKERIAPLEQASDRGRQPSDIWAVSPDR